MIEISSFKPDSMLGHITYPVDFRSERWPVRYKISK